LISRRILIGAEGVGVDQRGSARRRGELGSGNEPATLAQRHKLTDTVTVSGHRESLTSLDGIHDFLRSRPQIALGDLWLCAHAIYGSTSCYTVLHISVHAS
jgi:hypothetical protein